MLVLQAFTHYSAGNFEATIALANRVLELALREGGPLRIGQAHSLQLCRFYVGDFARVENYFVAGLKFFEDPDAMRLAETALTTVTGFMLASWNAWILGRADLARDRDARMIAVGNTTPHGRLWSANYPGLIRWFLREYEQVEALAAQALELCEQYQLPWYAAADRALLGIARSQLGRGAEGIALIRRGISEMRKFGTLAIGLLTAELAGALGREGAIVEALATVEQALQVNSDDVWYRPEIFRIRGELRLKHCHTELADADFRESIALAQKMGAKAWELRTTTSLARLLRDTGRRGEAHSILAGIYNWFTEGFDTADLIEAKALLDELAI